MTGFFWNMRGFNKSSKHKVVRSWIQNKELQFGCLLETRVKESKAIQIVSTVVPGWSFLNNYEYSQKGRIRVMSFSAPLFMGKILLRIKEDYEVI